MKRYKGRLSRAFTRAQNATLAGVQVDSAYGYSEQWIMLHCRLVPSGRGIPSIHSYEVWRFACEERAETRLCTTALFLSTTTTLHTHQHQYTSREKISWTCTPLNNGRLSQALCLAILLLPAQVFFLTTKTS